MSQALYQQLFRELDADGVRSAACEELIARLGSPGAALRGFALARRHWFADASADFRRALAAPDAAAIVAYACAIGLFVCRDYSRAAAALERAATIGKPGVAQRARALAEELADRQGWESHRRTPWPEGAAATMPARATDIVELAHRHGSAGARQALERLVAEHGPHPRLRAADVRLALLDGELDRARATFEGHGPDTIEHQPAIAALLALHQGAHKRVIVETTHHRGNVEMLYLRARGLITMDLLPEAAHLLERARQVLPTSIPILTELALTHAALRPDSFDEGLERRFEALVDWAPCLASDAAEAAGVSIWRERDLSRERETMLAIFAATRDLFTHDLALDRVAYRVPAASGEVVGGPTLRRVAPAPEGLAAASHVDELHANDGARLRAAESILVRAIGVRPPAPANAGSRPEPRTPSAGAWTPTFLEPEQIEQFLRDGFLVVEGAFDPAVAARWREDAVHRIREQPAQWVRGYDPDVGPSLAGFDPGEPATWTWPLIELRGSERVEIAEFSPDGWAAICDLLGGPDRIRTRSWDNYMIINLRANAELPEHTPQPGWSSWHIDDPSPLTRIDRINNGLVCIALFDDLLPRSGNTWLAPDSVPRVAADLAANPGGVDYCNDRGTHITLACERFHEVVGRAGDLVLFHPLMMHSSSPNASGRIRWMGNPMVYLEQPLDPFRPEPELSPVERAMHRAIRDVRVRARPVSTPL